LTGWDSVRLVPFRTGKECLAINQWEKAILFARWKADHLSHWIGCTARENHIHLDLQIDLLGERKTNGCAVVAQGIAPA
jgi:hypothetical protein